MSETIKTAKVMPALALRGLTAYPGVSMHFDVKRKKSILAINSAMGVDRKIFIVTQSDIEVEDPKITDLYKIGVVCTIKQLLKGENDTVRVLIEGEYKARLCDLLSEEKYLLAEIKPIKERGASAYPDDVREALVRLVKNFFRDYCLALPNPPREVALKVLAKDDPIDVIESIFPNIMAEFQEKQKVLEAPNRYNALEKIIGLLQNETNLLNVEHEIYDKVKQRMDKNQRDYFLREQQRIIAEELDEADSPVDDALNYLDDITAIKNISEESREKLVKECERLSHLPPMSQEGNVIRTYIETCLELPWDTFTKETLDVKKAQKQLDLDHYGLKKVKERILELLAVRQLNPDIKGQIICLVGPPGVGKTSIASSIAKTLNRRFARVSLGGVNDESEIRGHRKTYLGSMPGRVINAFRQAKTYNPLILFDEIDKMGNDYKGDPSSAMLEVLDSEQNSAFVDHYIELPFDLSRALFLTTANSLDTIPTPLRDRMEIIELSSYTREEKFQIAKRHLVKKQMEKHGVTKEMLSIRDSALFEIIDCYTREAGVRTLERQIGAVCRKAAKFVAEGAEKKLFVTDKNIEEFISRRRFLKNKPEASNKVGVVNGLAWTAVGGEMLEIECAVMEGAGKIKLTGSLGDVMKESADIAISYVRQIAKKYNIDSDFYKSKDIHIHAPEGAVPKDGPSAGVTMTTALVSALTGIPVRGDVAMTGEISLLGRVMPIGGLREKAMAAYREKKKVVVIPKENLPDLQDIDEVVLNAISFIPAEKIEDVLDIALLNENKTISDIIEKWCEPQSQTNDRPAI